MAHQFTTSHIQDSMDLLRHYKRLAERAMAQCPDDKLVAQPSAESNSVATMVKHMSGNMISRWTDFLTSDGEKPGRKRDTEFEEPPRERPEIAVLWERGWKCMLGALESLSEADLTKTVTIRSEPHSVLQAINRQIGHHAYHVGQIIFVCRYFAGDRWETLTIPKQKSEEFNARVAAEQMSQR